jgi:hypothetical protein
MPRWQNWISSLSMEQNLDHEKAKRTTIFIMGGAALLIFLLGFFGKQIDQALGFIPGFGPFEQLQSIPNDFFFGGWLGVIFIVLIVLYIVRLTIRTYALTRGQMHITEKMKTFSSRKRSMIQIIVLVLAALYILAIINKYALY